MSYLSYKDVRPVYYDKALKGKYSDTPAEAEMIDLIVKTRHTDFGCYMGFEGPVFTCQSMISNKNKNIASVWEQNKPVYKEKLTKAFAAFGMEFDQL